ncbi:cupin domain-containing protein [Rhizobium sp. ICMP 5592]|uniref:cupin domain-containing protein n=1 Tax=Rhizobium sp. ICMP 5592 TaxID=2292445 RepID=UPI001297E712|nr:cupin domain-containing protein [Rhizobium sp. ICMP 5592]MQB45018.1 cupin domain-containing protein [Rhizobium sp. ICMP 5592]
MKPINAFVAAFLFLSGGMAPLQAFANEPLLRTDLIKSDIDVPAHEVVQVRVDFLPGVLAARHSHPGEEIAYVIEGTLEYKLDGREPVTLSAGQSLFIPTGVAHSAQNVGTGKASELATYIVQKGQTLVVPSK